MSHARLLVRRLRSVSGAGMLCYLPLPLDIFIIRFPPR